MIIVMDRCDDEIATKPVDELATMHIQLDELTVSARLHRVSVPREQQARERKLGVS